jgi:hypothetical protein
MKRARTEYLAMVAGIMVLGFVGTLVIGADAYGLALHSPFNLMGAWIA